MRLIVAVCVLGIGRAWAQLPSPAPTTDDAQRALAQGVRLMDSGHLAEAREAFVKARELVPDAPNPYRLLGVVDFRLGRCREAVEELDAFLGKVGPNDRRVTEVVSMRDKCKEELQPKVGTLGVDSTPSGAELRLDDPNGALLGKTPHTVENVSAGPHVLFLSKVGFKPTSRGLSIARGDKLRLHFALERETVAEAPKKPVYKRGWFWGVMVATVAVVGAGVGLGVYFGVVANQPPPFDTTLPAFSLGLR